MKNWKYIKAERKKIKKQIKKNKNEKNRNNKIIKSNTNEKENNCGKFMVINNLNINNSKYYDNSINIKSNHKKMTENEDKNIKIEKNIKKHSNPRRNFANFGIIHIKNKSNNESNYDKNDNIKNDSRFKLKNQIKKKGKVNPRNAARKNKIKINFDDEKLKKILTKTKIIMQLNEEEINILPYKTSLKNDKRSYCEYYFSLLKTKHNFIFTFFNNTDYNLKIVKIDLFLLNFCISYGVNVLFFNDNTMHKIHEDEGDFNFIYQLPQIIYSSLISSVIYAFLKKLALSQYSILDYKHLKKKKDNIISIEEKEKNLISSIKMKIILYFIFSTILLLCFWYYISMFCAIYANTQLHLIKDTLISYGLSMIYPFGIYLLPGIFRIPSLSNSKNKKKYLYKISQILQMI